MGVPSSADETHAFQGDMAALDWRLAEQVDMAAGSEQDQDVAIPYFPDQQPV